MLMLYVFAGLTGAFVSAVGLAHDGWLVAAGTAPFVASMVVVIVAGIAFLTRSAAPGASSRQVPAGVVWC